MASTSPSRYDEPLESLPIDLNKHDKLPKIYNGKLIWWSSSEVLSHWVPSLPVVFYSFCFSPALFFFSFFFFPNSCPQFLININRKEKGKRKTRAQNDRWHSWKFGEWRFRWKKSIKKLILEDDADTNNPEEKFSIRYFLKFFFFFSVSYFTFGFLFFTP